MQYSYPPYGAFRIPKCPRCNTRTVRNILCNECRDELNEGFEQMEEVMNRKKEDPVVNQLIKKMKNKGNDND